MIKITQDSFQGYNAAEDIAATFVPKCTSITSPPLNNASSFENDDFPLTDEPQSHSFYYKMNMEPNT